MPYFYKKLFVVIIPVSVLYFSGCASHPVISPETLKKNEKVWGYSFATENIIPVLWFRKGLNANTELGYRIGLPISGTGFDLSRTVMKKENKRDVINFSWSLNPNYNFDITYYKIKNKSKRSLFSLFKKNKKENGEKKISWSGTRFMFIPEGVNRDKKSSMRIGYLKGGRISKNFGFEVGYFHDFSSMPLSKVFDSKWSIPGKNWKESTRLNSEWNGRYNDYDPMFPGEGKGLPSEYSRMTGISIQLFYYLGRYKKIK